MIDRPFGLYQSSSALPPRGTRSASRKTVSERTSYYQIRLAFHSLPQVIRRFCTINRFGPPSRFRGTSPCPRQAHLASGLYCTASQRSYQRLATGRQRMNLISKAGSWMLGARSCVTRPIKTRFRYAFAHIKCLDKQCKNKSLAHSSIGTLSLCMRSMQSAITNFQLPISN